VNATKMLHDVQKMENGNGIKSCQKGGKQTEENEKPK